MDKREAVYTERYCCNTALMKPLVFDATPLIHLSKVHILEKLPALKKQLLIPASVYEEVVVKGKEIGKDDAVYIERLVHKNTFTIINVKKQLPALPASILSPADIDVLSYAHTTKGYAVIDEDAARNVADIMEIKTIGSVGILFHLLKAKAINKKDAKIAIDKMIENGWFCSPQLYSYIVGKLG
jgi:predicted nucleic acid-binding protein